MSQSGPPPTPIMLQPEVLFGFLGGVAVLFVGLMVCSVRSGYRVRASASGRSLTITRTTERDRREKMIAAMTEPKFWDAVIDGDEGHADWTRSRPLSVSVVEHDEKSSASKGPIAMPNSTPETENVSQETQSLATIARALSSTQFYRDSLALPFLRPLTSSSRPSTAGSSRTAQTESSASPAKIDSSLPGTSASMTDARPPHPDRELQVSVLIVMPSPPPRAASRPSTRSGEKDRDTESIVSEGASAKPYMLGVSRVPWEGGTDLASRTRKMEEE